MGLFRRNAEPDAVIDLRERLDPAPTGSPQWGSPIPCPHCSGRGYLDHIDPFREIMYLHCTECSAKYEITRAELERIDA